MTKDSVEDNHLHHILQLAALFNTEFSIDWLLELSREKPQTMLVALDSGVKRGWLVNEKPGIYRFCNSREQAALIESLPADEREEHYRRIAGILMGEARQDSGEKEILVHSLLHINNSIDGCRRLLQEGRQMVKQSCLRDAVGLFKKVVDDLSRQKGEKADLLLLETVTELARVSISTDDYPVSIQTIRYALTRAKRPGCLPYRALLRMHLAEHEYFKAEFSSAMRNFQDGWALVAEIEDAQLKRSAHFLRATFLFWQGRFRDALELYEELTPEIDRLPRTAAPLTVRPLHGLCLVHCGEITQGLGMLKSVINIGHQLKSNFVSSWSELMMGIACCGIGRFDESVKFLEDARSKSEKGEHINIKVSVLLTLAYSNLKLGNVASAVSALEEFQRTQRQVPVNSVIHAVLILLCQSMQKGELPQVEGFFDVDEIVSQALQSPNVYLKGIVHMRRALMMKQSGHTGREVIKAYLEALEWLEQSGHRIAISQAELGLTGEYLEQGDENQARTKGNTALKLLLTANRNLIPKNLLHLEKKLRTSEDVLQEIFQLGQEVATIRDNRKLVGRIISTANRLTGAERGALFLVEEKSRRMVLRASKNLTSEDVASPVFKDAMSIIIETARSGKGRVIEFKDRLDKKMAGEGFIKACICVPMILRNNSFGVLYHDHFDSKSAFSNADLEVLNYFAAQAAIAMDNAQAYQALEAAVEKQKEEKQYFQKQYLEELGFEDIVGKSPAIKEVFHQIESVALTGATVLILGETGVGKELVARAIHRLSSRRDKPFIRVNCSAFSENLISSELFGHEKGAFTGAIERSVGRFELADGGTLFLDEIGDIPMDTQIRLLRVLQNKEFERVGGHKTLRSDFRLLAATNRDLEKEVHAGKFRQDLFFRLNVFPIQVPTLRDRREDIPLLAYHFLRSNSKKMGRTIESISKSDISKLKAYHWPGNVRELENIIERGVILSSGPNLQIPDAGFKIPATHKNAALVSLEENERNHILRVLKKTGWQIAGQGGAAEILQIPPSTLRHRLKKLGIRKSDWTFIYAQGDMPS